MEDLIPPQIRDSCKLALPEGLKDLMSDITREVLRYQPRNLCKFIADYLSVLLVTRDNLSVAGHICSGICDCGCEPELQHELTDLGLDEEDAEKAKTIIVNYFKKDTVNEGNLIKKLMDDNIINVCNISAVQDAIRTAFARHQARNTTVFESSSESGEDEVMCAAKHTLDLYRKTLPIEETYEFMAQKIQATYRAYGVRRLCTPKEHVTPAKFSNKNVTYNADSTATTQRSSYYDIPFPRTSFGEQLREESLPEDADIAMSSSMNKKRVTTMSSTSLAGSFLALPSYKPYSAHECEVLSDLEEIPEREHAYIDYTDEHPHISMVTEEKGLLKPGSNHKRISFSDSVPEAAKKMVFEDEYDSESRDDDQNSWIETEPRLFYSDVMKIDDDTQDGNCTDSYDGDIENEKSDNVDDQDFNRDVIVLDLVRNEIEE